jgi:hypothetical protein
MGYEWTRNTRNSRRKTTDCTGGLVWRSRHVHATYDLNWDLWNLYPAMQKQHRSGAAARLVFASHIAQQAHVLAQARKPDAAKEYFLFRPTTPYFMLHHEGYGVAYSSDNATRPAVHSGSNTVVTQAFMAAALVPHANAQNRRPNEADGTRPVDRGFTQLGTITRRYNVAVRAHAETLGTADMRHFLSQYLHLYDGAAACLSGRNVAIIPQVLEPVKVTYETSFQAFRSHAAALQAFDFMLCQLVLRAGVGFQPEVPKPRDPLVHLANATRVVIPYRVPAAPIKGVKPKESTATRRIGSEVTVGVCQARVLGDLRRIALMGIGRMLLGYYEHHQHFRQTLRTVEAYPIELVLLADCYNNVVDDEQSHREFMAALKTTLDNNEYVAGYPTTSPVAAGRNDRAKARKAQRAQAVRISVTAEDVFGRRLAASERAVAVTEVPIVTPAVIARAKAQAEAAYAQQTAEDWDDADAVHDPVAEAEYLAHCAAMAERENAAQDETTANPDYSAWADSLPE